MTMFPADRRKLAFVGFMLTAVTGMTALAQPVPAPANGTNQTAIQPPPVRVMGVFRPLNKDLREEVIAALKSLPGKYGTNRAPIRFNCVGGNNRPILAREMIMLLKQAGLDAQMGDTDLLLQMPADSLPEIFIKCNDAGAPFAADLSQAFIGLAPQKISVVRAPEWASGRVEIIILDDPVFSPAGAVTFK
jgi:hypothetical protein